MLTGQAAFQGEDVTEILASVVKASVNLNALPANIHPSPSLPPLGKIWLFQNSQKPYKSVLGAALRAILYQNSDS